jgi:hypothetical protein
MSSTFAKNKTAFRSKKLTFSMFSDAMRELIDSLKLRTFVLLLDHVEHLDSNLIEKILSSNELVHPNIRVIAIRRNLLGVDCTNMLTVPFPTYSDSTMVKIIEQKIGKIAGQMQFKSPQKKESPTKSPKKRPLSKSPGDTSTTTTNSYPISAQEVAAFMEVLQNILPRLRMTTGHIEDIMNVTLQVWGLSARQLVRPGQGQGQGGGQASTSLGLNSSSVYASLTQSVLKLPFLRYFGGEECGYSLPQEHELPVDPESRKRFVV